MIEDRNLVKFYINLTQRKKEVVELVSQGHTNDSVAARLYISSGVVADHLSDIFGDLANYEELAQFKPNRQLVTSLFAPFFERHPEMRNDSLQTSIRH